MTFSVGDASGELCGQALRFDGRRLSLLRAPNVKGQQDLPVGGQ